MKRVSNCTFLLVLLSGCVAFDESLLEPAVDAGPDGTSDSTTDTIADAPFDSASDTPTDVPTDTGPDVPADTGGDTGDTGPPPVQCFAFDHNDDSSFDYYRLGDANQSCSTVCGTHGGVDSATLNVVGQSGANGRIYFCEDVLQGLMSSSATVANDTSISKGLGCALHVSSGLFKRYTAIDTTQAAFDAAVRRVCACVDPC